MISTKFCRYKLLKILEELSRNLDKTHRIKIQKEINFLVNYVKRRIQLWFGITKNFT